MSRISGLRNDMNKRTFYKERKINKRCIHVLCKQNIKAPLILDMYVNCYQNFGVYLDGNDKENYEDEVG